MSDLQMILIFYYPEILDLLQSGQSFKQVVDHLVSEHLFDEHFASNCVFAVKLQEGL